MKTKFPVFVILLHLNAIHAETTVQKTVRPIKSLGNDGGWHPSMQNDDCSLLLSSKLVDEIRSYQPIVNRIVAAAINTEFSGNTWNRLVLISNETQISS